MAAVALGAVLVALVYLLVAFPKSEPATDVVVQGTPERIERGRYLFHHVAACAECHAVHDRSRLGDPVVPGGLGRENYEEWVARSGFFPPNLTPAALGSWSDGEILRAIASGIREDGQALFPAMPYDLYGKLAQPDLEALVAYIRTLDPIPVEHPRERLALPLNLIARLAPRPARPPAEAPRTGLSRGEYLVEVAGCRFCHTPFEGTPPRAVKALTFAGGHEFPVAAGVVRTANITPDTETGIGEWTRDRFLARFQAVREGAATGGPKPAGTPPTVMPWANYAGMREEDLAAIYEYLRTVEPVRHRVTTFEPDPGQAGTPARRGLD
jgi:mono/diheme cytochrome c family protein